MKRLLAILFLLPTFAALGATGDAKWWRFETNGMWIQICWEGMATNAAFNWTCWGTNNTLIGLPDVYVKTTTPGYGTAGNATTRQRIILGTKQLRGVAPNQGAVSGPFFVTQSGSDAITWVATHEYAYASETNMLLTVKAGWYGTSRAVTDLPGTNIVQQGFGNIIAAVSEKYFDRAAGPYQRRISAWHRHGTNLSPVAYVKFTTEDAHGHSYSTIVNRMDQNLDYVGTIDTSSFTALDTLTNHYEVGPWIGNAVLSTVARTHDIQTPYLHWTETLFDPSNGYGGVYAVVNPTNGVLHGSVLLSNISDFGNPPTAFDTLGHAFADCAATNLLVYGHNDNGNTTVYVRGPISFIGAGSPPTTRGRTWSTIKAYPTDPQWSASIANGTGNGKVDGFTVVDGFDLTSTDNSTFTGNQNLHFENCRFNTSNGALVDTSSGTSIITVKNCYVANFGQGFSHSGAQAQCWAMLDHIEVNGPCPRMHPYFVRGTYKHSTNQTSTFLSTSQTGLPFSADGACIIINNRFVNLNFDNSTFISLFAGSQSCSNGFVLVQNEIENIVSYPAGQIVDIHSDLATGHLTNGIFGLNLVKGQRFGCLYNKEGSTPYWTVLCKEFGDVIERIAYKEDTVAPTDGGRIGGWAGLFGVSSSGNAAISSTNRTEGGGQFLRNWVGINSFQPTLTTVSPESGSPTPTGWAKFLSDGSSIEWFTTGTGNGNYRLHTDSPIANLRQEQIVPYDIDGFACGSFDGPGPHRGNQGCAAKAVAAF